MILENAKLEMDKNIGENTLYGFYGISETCFIQACLNMNLNFYENSRNGKGYGFFNCNQCDYLNCMTEINSSGYFPFFSSFQCKNSKFYHCEAKLQTEAESASSTANAFYLCISGIFYDCMVSVNSNSEIEKPGFMSHIEDLCPTLIVTDFDTAAKVYSIDAFQKQNPLHLMRKHIHFMDVTIQNCIGAMRFRKDIVLIYNILLHWHMDFILIEAFFTNATPIQNQTMNHTVLIHHTVFFINAMQKHIQIQKIKMRLAAVLTVVRKVNYISAA